MFHKLAKIQISLNDLGRPHHGQHAHIVNDLVQATCEFEDVAPLSARGSHINTVLGAFDLPKDEEPQSFWRRKLGYTAGKLTKMVIDQCENYEVNPTNGQITWFSKKNVAVILDPESRRVVHRNFFIGYLPEEDLKHLLPEEVAA